MFLKLIECLVQNIQLQKIIENKTNQETTKYSYGKYASRNIRWKSKTRIRSSDIRVTSLNPRVKSSNPQFTSSNPRATSSNPRVTELRVQIHKLGD